MFSIRSTVTSTTVVSQERKYVVFIEFLNHLNPELWKTNINANITFADDDIRQLCQRFRQPQDKTVQAFREFVDNGPLPDGLKAMCCAINTLVVFTADCERAFSCMNDTLTATGNTQAVDTLSSLIFLSVCGLWTANI